MKEMRKRKENPHRHFYEEEGIDILDESLVNLSIGAPGTDMLSKCCRLFETATNHRMAEKIFASSVKSVHTEPQPAIMENPSAFALRREPALRHLFDKSDFNVYDKAIINLSVGAPGPDLLHKCCELFEDATGHRMDIELKTNSFLFQYGPSPGSYEVRTELASFLSSFYRDKVYSEDIVVTSGASHGIHLILSTLIDMSGVIFVDEVTYMIALDTFRQFTNMNVISVPLTKNGVDTAELRKNLVKYRFKSKSKLFWSMYYAIPTFHNPTGILFSDAVCKELIKLAREFDMLVACDDVYNMLSYKDNPPKRLYAYDNINDEDYKGNVISNGTFSKIIAPGVRLGWMECPPRCAELLNVCGILKSGGCVNNYVAGVIASSLQLGTAQEHIENLSIKYKERMLATCNILREKLPTYCTFVEPAGGYFIWIELPKHMDAVEFNDFCVEKYKVYVIPGDRFSVHGRFRNCFRISIAFHSKEILVDAALKLCKAIEDYCCINKS